MCSGDCSPDHTILQKVVMLAQAFTWIVSFPIEAKQGANVQPSGYNCPTEDTPKEVRKFGIYCCLDKELVEDHQRISRIVQSRSVISSIDIGTSQRTGFNIQRASVCRTEPKQTKPRLFLAYGTDLGITPARDIGSVPLQFQPTEG